MEDPAATAVLVDGSVDVADLICLLRAEVAELRQEVNRLRRENLELRQQAGYWQGQHVRAVERAEQLQQLVHELEAENRKLRQQAFGRSSEKASASAADWLKELQDTPTSPPRRRGQQANNPGPKRRDYQQLPVRTEIIELPQAKRCCPQCGQPYAERAETEDSEQIEIEVQAYRRVLKRRRYQPQCRCRGPWQIVTAPAAPKLIAKSRYGVSLWVEILLEKFLGQRPTERLLGQWRLLGLDLPAGTVTEGLRRLEPLFEPIYQALVARQQGRDFWQGDETRWRVFAVQEGKVGYCWWLWVFVSEDTVVYRLDPSRSHKVPQGHLQRQDQACSGTMMVDRYAAYKAMIQVNDGEIILVFCWAHVRRDFIRVGKSWPELKDWALTWLCRIRDLYRLNGQRLLALTQEANHSAFQQAERAVRQQVLAMYEQAQSECAQPALRQPCRKVLTSLLEHWTGLTHFVDDPRIPLDNNACERQLRGPVVGRKNYYGSGSVWSGRLAAMLFSVLGTLERCQVNPREWLEDYLQACAQVSGRPPPDAENWLPWQYLRNQPRLPNRPG
jgi:transposase